MKLAIVTGGAGCGKSAFSKFVVQACRGRIVSFSCDEAASRLWNDSSFVRRASSTLFPYLPKQEQGGELNRKIVRELVFRNVSARRQLETLMHPLIFAELEESWLSSQKISSAKVFLAEVPLYYETRASLPADTVIVVAASRMAQRARLIEHRSLDVSTSEAVLDSQLPLEVKTEKADVVIWNDGNSAAMEAQAGVLLKSHWPELF